MSNGMKFNAIRNSAYLKESSMKKIIHLVVSVTLILSVAVANATSINHNVSKEDGKFEDVKLTEDRSINERSLIERFKEEKNREEKAKKAGAEQEKAKVEKVKEEKVKEEKVKEEKVKEEKVKEEKVKEEKVKEEKVKEEKVKEEKVKEDLISCKSSDGCGLDVNNGIDDLVKPHKDEDTKLVDGHCNKSSPSLCQINHDNKLSSIPEPATYVLFVLGAVGLITMVRRQTKIQKILINQE
jgi:flagellar biosynthesis GTPase FlhF